MKQTDFEDFLKNLDKNGELSAHLPQRIVWLSGSPGSGKGTHTRTLIDFFGLYQEPLIASSLLKTPEMLEKINQGLLLDDKTVTTAVFEALKNPLYQSGVLVDGFPRTDGQAYSIEWFYKKLSADGRQPQFISDVLLTSEETSIERQVGRGRRAQAHNERVKQTGKGELKEVRATDLDPNVARKRYEVFMKETYAAVKKLDGKIPFVSVNADGTLEAVKAELSAKLRQLSLEP